MFTQLCSLIRHCCKFHLISAALFTEGSHRSLFLEAARSTHIHTCTSRIDLDISMCDNTFGLTESKKREKYKKLN